MNGVAFYLDNSGITDTNFQEPLKGNPGVGATEFMTVLVASELKKRNMNVYLLSTSPGNFPTNIKCFQVNNLEKAFDFSELNNLILIIRAHVFEFESILEKIATYKDLNIVVWAHLTPNQRALKMIANTTQIKAVICLENNQRVRMGDSLVNSKLLTIPYGITGSTDLVQVSGNANNVAFVGALVPQKGFHLLADAWPRVIDRIPDAKLYVFGSGRLYDSRIELGSQGIATKEYENRIFKKLGRDDKSVLFLNNADSSSRNSVLNTCKIGIVNPSARTETFCLSAVEFQQRGIPVIGGRKYGLLDTVAHRKTGLLVLNASNLHRHIIRLLSDNQKLGHMGLRSQSYVLSKYELEEKIERWYLLFGNLLNASSGTDLGQAKEMRIRSLQGVLVRANRPLVSITKGYWPTGVGLWESVKKTRIKIMRFRNR
jgi:glycosyltransferase involved in cell wall biosynthesis